MKKITDKKLIELARNLEKAHEGFLTLEFDVTNDGEYILARASYDMLWRVMELCCSDGDREGPEGWRALAQLKAAEMALYKTICAYEKAHNIDGREDATIITHSEHKDESNAILIKGMVEDYTSGGELVCIPRGSHGYVCSPAGRQFI